MPQILFWGILLYIVYKNSAFLGKVPKIFLDLPFCFFLRYTKIERIWAIEMPVRKRRMIDKEEFRNAERKQDICHRPQKP